jgi:uncharacterized Zn-finger protein
MRTIPDPVLLAARDLNPQGGIFCPAPQAGMAQWSGHPRVFLDVGRTGEAKCPYCGTVYRMKAGETVSRGH